MEVAGIQLKQISFTDLVDYFKNNHLTLIPVKNGTKKPYYTITKEIIAKWHGTDENKDSFHVPLPQRLTAAKNAIMAGCADDKTQAGMGLGATFSKGWHGDKNYVVVDFDGEYNEYIGELYRRYPTFACRGARGIKLVYGVDSEDKINYQYIRDDGHIEVFGGNMKHLAVFHGIHPHNTPENPIRYKQNIDHDIPTLNWSDLKRELDRLSLKYGFRLHTIKQIIIPPPVSRPNRSFNLLKMGIDEVIRPYDAILTKPPSGYNCTHPIEGSSKGNKNLVYNTLTDSWYCADHGTGGGIIQWLAIKYDLIRCEDCTGISPVKGKIWQDLMIALIGDGYFTYEEYRDWRNGVRTE